MKREERKVVNDFFGQFPPTHAIPRVNEALVLRKIKFPSPALDLGCGDGQFALFTFGRGKIKVGLDKNVSEGKRAEKSGAYQKVVVADALRLPLADRSFATVIANSVLEHMENLDLVLGELSRILRQKGLLVLTVPTPLVSQYQFWSKFIPGWARLKEKLWRHVNYFDERKWRKKLSQTGFKVVFLRRTNSKEAIRWSDLLFPFFLLGPIKSLAPFLQKRRVFGEDKEGATLLIVAKKDDKSSH